jgi:hypothetical protein
MEKVLAMNLAIAGDLRPAVIVGAVCLAISVIGLIRKALKEPAKSAR